MAQQPGQPHQRQHERYGGPLAQQEGFGGQQPVGAQRPTGEFGQQQVGGQPGQTTAAGQFGQRGPLGQRMGQRFDQSIPSEIRTTIDDLDRVASVAEWTKARAAERGMPRVVRVCDDIEDIAHLEKKLIIRQSPFAQPIGQQAQQVIQQGLQELQQYVNEPEVEDAINKARRSVDSIDRGLASLRTMEGQQTQQTGQQTGQPAHPVPQGGQQYQPQGMERRHDSPAGQQYRTRY